MKKEQASNLLDHTQSISKKKKRSILFYVLIAIILIIVIVFAYVGLWLRWYPPTGIS